MCAGSAGTGGLAGRRRARLRLLGGFGLWRDGERVAPARNESRLIALIGIHDRPVSRAFVARTLWPRAPGDRAATRLRSALHRVRELAPALLDGGPDAVALAPGVEVDARRLAAWARRALEPGTEVPDLGREASGGELLPDWDDDWVLLERERLRHLRLRALEAVTTRLAAVGNFAEAIAAGRAAVAAGPLRESARRALIGAYTAAGRTEAAAAEYDEYCDLLASHLGLRPSPLLAAALGDAGRSSRSGDASVTASG